MIKDRIKIYLKAYDHRLLDRSTKKLVSIIEKTGASVAGPIPLPTKIKKYTVLKSVFVNKDSKEQFDIRVHRRLLEVPGSDPKVVASLSSLTLPSGIGIEIKQIT